jgi:hypothetical protein
VTSEGGFVIPSGGPGRLQALDALECAIALEWAIASDVAKMLSHMVAAGWEARDVQPAVRVWWCSVASMALAGGICEWILGERHGPIATTEGRGEATQSGHESPDDDPKSCRVCHRPMSEREEHGAKHVSGCWPEDRAAGAEGELWEASS